MPDQIFENPRLVAIYDSFDGDRRDLDLYVAIAKEFQAKSILDLGCGTGCLACLLSENGFNVIGVDPAQASLNVARKKQNADQVQWILGDGTTLPDLSVELAVMTGNVAQVFLTDNLFVKTLLGLRKILYPNGYLVFEVRDPSQKAWLDWIREKTYQRIDVPEIGYVEGWCEVTSFSKDLVSFQWTYVFESDGQVMTSESTLRFREQEEIESLLEESGFRIQEIRDAPDRPGKEFVFIAKVTIEK